MPRHLKYDGENPHFTGACVDRQGNQKRVLRLAGIEISTLLLLLTGRRARPAMPFIVAGSGSDAAWEKEAGHEADEVAKSAGVAGPVEGSDGPLLAKKLGHDGLPAIGRGRLNCPTGSA